MGERFLISRLSSLGDVVCSLPAASALKRGFPSCEIDWVVDPRFAAIPERCSAVDRVIEAKPKFDPRTWPRLGQDGNGYAAALDLQGLSKSAIVVRRARAKVKVGFHWQREGAWLGSRAVVPDPTSWHVVDQYVDVARAVGGVADIAEFALAPRPGDAEAVRSKLGGLTRFVVMNAGAGWPTKRWPVGHCAALVDLLSRERLVTVLVGGKAEDDRRVAQEVVDACASDPLDLTGQTTIGELIAIIALGAAHVGGDTGSTHLAAALGVPAVGLYSITRPTRSCPYGQIERCHFDPQSLARILPEAVFATVMEAAR